MPNWSGSMLTVKGQALQAKVDAGQTILTLTKMKIGSGSLADGQSIVNLTDLISPQQNVGISAINAKDNITTVTGVITNTGISTGFYVRELGLFATDTDGKEILYSMIIDSAPDYLPPAGDSVTVSMEFAYHIIVSNAANVQALIDQNGLVTASILADHNSDPNAHSLMTALHLRQNSKSYAVGDIAYSLTLPSYAYLECTVAGTTAATEPTWPSVGQTVVDGTVTWAVRDLRVADDKFDVSTKTVNSAFLKKKGFQLGGVVQLAATTTLTAEHIGKLIEANSNLNFTLTLPSYSVLPDGATISFMSITGGVTIRAQGTEIIFANATAINFMSLNNGDTLILVYSKTADCWFAVGGSAQMIAAGSIVSGGPGWRKFADGTLEQFGSGSTGANGMFTVTLPIQFYNTNYIVLLNEVDASAWTGIAATIYGANNTTFSTTQFSGKGINLGGSGAISGLGFFWKAEGRWKA